jgi:hypothetical protein
MQKHHWPAVVLAGINIVLLTIDRVVAIGTGKPTFVTDDSRGGTATALAMGVLLGVTFLALGRVVRQESVRFETARRPARLARPVLTFGLLLLGVGFLAVTVLQPLQGNEEDPALQASGVVAFLALTAVSVACLVVGVAVIGHNPLGIGGVVLSALGPAMVATGLLAVVAPALASPVYCTMVVLGGTALLGVGAKPVAPSARARALTVAGLSRRRRPARRGRRPARRRAGASAR